MPVVVYAQPFSSLEYGKYLENIMNDGLELRERIDRYRLLSTLTDELEEFRIKDSEGAEATVKEIPASSKSSGTTEELRFPLKGRFSDGEIVLDPETFKITQIERND